MYIIYKYFKYIIYLKHFVECFMLKFAKNGVITFRRLFFRTARDMNRTERCFLLLIICVLLSNYQVNSDRDARLSRKRRYVVFPEGSTFSVSSYSMNLIC